MAQAILLWLATPKIRAVLPSSSPTDDTSIGLWTCGSAGMPGRGAVARAYAGACRCIVASVGVGRQFSVAARGVHEIDERLAGAVTGEVVEKEVGEAVAVAVRGAGDVRGD